MVKPKKKPSSNHPVCVSLIISSQGVMPNNTPSPKPLTLFFWQSLANYGIGCSTTALPHSEHPPSSWDDFPIMPSWPADCQAGGRCQTTKFLANPSLATSEIWAPLGSHEPWKSMIYRGIMGHFPWRCSITRGYKHINIGIIVDILF